jgi:hypothetical protein
MARLSTGQSYGDTSRVSAARLLGGIPVEGSGEALAQGSISAPSLQPRATPVDTFQRVGAPTLGGAPKFFAPPDLPNPGQDLANLSKALGGFSSTLQSFGETWLASKKEEDKRQEAATGALVGQASRFGPAREIADLASNLEKAAALGNPDAARMLQVVRERQNSSVGRYWLERSVEQNAIQGAALSLTDRLASAVRDQGGGWQGRRAQHAAVGRPQVPVSTGTSCCLAGQVQMSTPGYAKNQGIIVQAQLQADQAQRKRYNTNMAGMVTGQATVNRQSIARDYVALWQKPGGNTEAAAGSHYGFVGNAMQQQIDQIRLLGLPEEAKTKLINDYLEGFASDVVAAIKFKGVFTEDLSILLKPALRSVMTGPVDQRIKADGTPNQALRLFNTLGGEAYLDKVVAKANAAQIQDNTQQSQMAGIQEQQAYDARLSAALPEGRRSDPAAIKSFFQAERERAAVEPDGIQRAARFAQIDASERQLTETFVKPVQEQRALWYAQQLGQTVNDEAARNRVSAQLQADLAAGIVTSATATSVQTSLSAQGDKEVRTYDKDINKRIDTLSKEWVTYSGSPNSYGGSAVVGFESQALYKFRDEARRRSYDVVYQAIKDGKDPVQALNQLWTNSNFGLRRREEVGGTQAPMYENGAQLIKKNTGNWSRSTIAPQDANNLRGQSKVRPLYGAEAFATDVDALLNGAPSQNFRTLLKTLTTGPGGQKPSEVILNQFRLQGIDVPEDVRQRIQALDGQEISRAPAPRRTAPQQNGADGSWPDATGQVGSGSQLDQQVSGQQEHAHRQRRQAAGTVRRRVWLRGQAVG